MNAGDKFKDDFIKTTEADYSFAVNLMQFLVVPTFVLDIEGKVIIWNKACERLTGIPAAEVMGTKEHWRGFYGTFRPCLADLIVQNRSSEIAQMYASHYKLSEQSSGVHAENWCVMPRFGTQLYLSIDVGPVFDIDGKLLAVVETLHDMSIQKNAQDALELLANRDGLTDIANRRRFDKQLKEEWERASRGNLSVSLLMVDADHFKSFNDLYGHQAGDECLKQIAAALSLAIYRPSDLVARYGGEEFAVIMPTIDEKGARIVADRILEKVAGLAIPHSGSDIASIVTVSVGLATLNPSKNNRPDELIGRADHALYEAKRMGRNQMVVFKE